MANYTLPSTTRISRVNRTLGSSTFLQASPFSGGVQSQDWGGSWWEYDIDFDVTQDAEGKALSAFLTRLRGPANTFTFRDPSINNKYQPGTIRVKGAGQTGNTLVTDGWAPVEGNLLLNSGDFTLGWVGTSLFIFNPSNNLSGSSITGQLVTNNNTGPALRLRQTVTTVDPTKRKNFRVIFEDGGEITATDTISIGIWNLTKLSWMAIYRYNFSTDAVTATSINNDGAFDAGFSRITSWTPTNGGTRVVDLTVSVNTTDFDDVVEATIYPTGTLQNGNSVHLYFTSFAEGFVSGAPPSSHILLDAGDFISVGSGADARLHQVVQDANMITADRSCNLVIEPALRSSPADNTVVEVVDPLVALRPLQPVPNAISTPTNYRFTMQARENI